MDYLTWVKIIAMAIRLMQEPAFEKDFRVHTSWSSVDKLFLGSKLRTSVLNIDIYPAGSEEKIKSYVFIPWEDYYDMLEQTDDMVIPAMLNMVYTVTPYAIIYEVGGNPAAVLGKEDILGIFESRFCELIGFEYCNAVMAKNEGITLPGQLQAITFSERRFFVDICAATPGSKPVDPGRLRETFPEKMIYLVMTPDIGSSHKQWIKGTEPDFKPYFENIKDELARILPDTVKKYEPILIVEHGKKKSPGKKETPDPDKTIKTKAEEKPGVSAKKEGVEVKKTSGRKEDTTAETSEILPGDITFPMDEPFPDYSPKVTPDDVPDYMPTLADGIANLPEPVLENLPRLINLFWDYQAEAVMNPGEWVDGNMILGAKPREYHPSPSELMMGETGERIRIILEENEPGDIRKVLDKQLVETRQIRYRKFSFIHYDVMGSGRFFYVENIEELSLHLPEKE